MAVQQSVTGSWPRRFKLSGHRGVTSSAGVDYLCRGTGVSAIQDRPPEPRGGAGSGEPPTASPQDGEPEDLEQDQSEDRRGTRAVPLGVPADKAEWHRLKRGAQEPGDQEESSADEDGSG
jgi:hypothetical protein